MLTEEERSSIASLLAEVGGQKEARGEDVARLLLRLPSKPEALGFLLQLARDQDHPCRPLIFQTLTHLQALLDGVSSTLQPAAPTDLERLLRSADPYPAKVQALIESVKREDRAAVEVVRRLIHTESNAFVLATMASFLGRLGDTSDRERLGLLLQNEDLRVVANALEALNRLGLSLSLETLAGYLEHGDVRIRINALSMLARIDQGKALDRIPQLMGSRDPGLRSAVAHLLGQLTAFDRPRGLPMILQMLDAEDKVPVLKQIAPALRKNVAPKNVEAVIGPLHAMKSRSIGGKLSMIGMLMQEIAVEFGLVESQVKEIGERYQRELEQKRGLTVTQESMAVASSEIGQIVEDPPEEPEKPGKPPPPPAPPPLFPEAPPEAPPGPSVVVKSSSLPAPPPPAGSIEPADINTTMKIDVKKELEEAEDEPLTFSGVWGNNQAAAEGPAAQKRNTQTIRTTQTMRKPSPSRVTKMPTGKFKVEEPEEKPPFRIPRQLVGALAAVVVIVGVVVFSVLSGEDGPSVAAATPKAPPSASTSKPPPKAMRTPKPRAAPAKRQLKGNGLQADDGEENTGAGMLGPQGSKLDIEGTVVRCDKGRIILKSKGRFYLVKGAHLPTVEAGSTYRTSGILGGVAQNGLVFVDATET